MTIHWLLTAAALLLAIGAFLRIRNQAKRLERLTESYWELRYEHSQLRAQLARIEAAPAADAAGEPEPPMRPAGGGTYIPLSSLKR